MERTDAVLTTEETAAYLKISTRTLVNLRSAGRGPPGARLGRQWRYSRAALDAWLAGRADYSSYTGPAPQSGWALPGTPMTGVPSVMPGRGEWHFYCDGERSSACGAWTYHGQELVDDQQVPPRERRCSGCAQAARG
ncbi:MAG TPA: helix-turn-helix domain-containing protein [Actinomycetes bacterium]|jgi:excisionase family DNA binding protein|nr:helix-turn-helix domain-containing protein [Actinomycetes bacterium]